MARVGHEAPLAGEAVLEPAEHGVERLAEPADLITRAREREAPAGRVAGDLGGLAAHLLDRPEGGGREEITRGGGEEQGERPDDEELGEELVERLVPVLERRTDDEGGSDEQAHRLATDLTREEKRAVLRAGRLLRGDQRSADPRRRGGRRAVWTERLGDVFLVARADAATVCERLRPHLEALVELLAQCVVEPYVEQRSDRAQHHGHREREAEREAQAKREAAHDSSRRR